jgi:hypothetical protein
MSDEFRREVVFTPAFDKRHADDGRNYGIHGVDLRFHLIGEHGATHFVVFTNWQLPEITKELDIRPIDRRFPHLSCHPSPADIGYHRLTPSYEGQEPLLDSCDLLGGKPCYSDGSGLMAREVFEKLIREGDAAVWRELEEWYRERVLAETEPAY